VALRRQRVSHHGVVTLKAPVFSNFDSDSIMGESVGHHGSWMEHDTDCIMGGVAG